MGKYICLPHVFFLHSTTTPRGTISSATTITEILKTEARLEVLASGTETIPVAGGRREILPNA